RGLLTLHSHIPLFPYTTLFRSRHFLHNLAPVDRIKNCNWFKPETPDGKPTRNQRIKYAIQGGIDDELLEKWGFEVEELHEIIKRSEEHTSELQSRENLVCRLLH